MAEVCIGISIPDEQTITQEAIDCILNQSVVDLEVVLFSPAEAPDYLLQTDPRIRALKLSNLNSKQWTQLQLLQSLAEISSAPLLISMQANQYLLPGTLSDLLSEIRSDENIDMVFTLQFEADESGHISRPAYHLQWEQAQALQSFETGSVENFMNLEFLPDNIRIYRRNVPGSNAFRAPFIDSSNSFYWSAHTNLNSRLYLEPVSIFRKPAPADISGLASSIRGVRDFQEKIVALFRNQEHLQTPFGWTEVWNQVFKYFWWHNTVLNACRRGSERVARWRTRKGLSARLYWFNVWLFSRWPIPSLSQPKPKSAIKKKIGYYIWQYPVRSQTFVQREVAALLKASEDVVVITEIEAEHDFIGELRAQLDGSAIRNTAPQDNDHRLLRWKMFRQAPIRFVSLYLFVLGTRYHPKKNRWFDRDLFNTALQLTNLVQERGINHLHSPWADVCAFISLIAARLQGIPYSVQARAHDIHRKDYLFGLQEKFVNAEFVVTNTQYNVNQIQCIIGKAHSEKVRKIHNGLNLGQFQLQRMQGPENGEIRLLCVARLIGQKGLEYLLNACRQLLDNGCNLRCDIVGGYEDLFMDYYIELKRLHRALDLEDTVHFAGSLPFDEVLNYYQKADIFVLPCVIADDGSRDIIPNSVLEAMAMQLPVVSTTVTGLPEMVDDGRTGFLVPPHDVEALVFAIKTLVDSAELRAGFGLAARQKVEEFFDSDTNVFQYQALFGGNEFK